MPAPCVGLGGAQGPSPGERSLVAATVGAQCVQGRQGGPGCDQTVGSAQEESQRHQPEPVPSPPRGARGMAEAHQAEEAEGQDLCFHPESAGEPLSVRSEGGTRFLR